MPHFSSLSDTNKVKNKTALDMRDFLTWVGGVHLKIPLITKLKTDINLSLNSVRIVDKTKIHTFEFLEQFLGRRLSFISVY